MLKVRAKIINKNNSTIQDRLIELIIDSQDNINEHSRIVIDFGDEQTLFEAVKLINEDNRRKQGKRYYLDILETPSIGDKILICKNLGRSFSALGIDKTVNLNLMTKDKTELAKEILRLTSSHLETNI